MDSKNIKYHGIDIARGIAIILVVWGHADTHMNINFVNKYLHFINKAIYSFHIPLFLMISGALAALHLKKNDFSLLKYLNKKFIGLIIPFYTLNSVFFILYCIASKSFTNAPSKKSMLIHMAIHQSHKDLPSGVLWFLFALFIFTAINAFILKKIGMNKYVWLFISLSVMFASPYLIENYFFAIDRITRNLYFFVMGYVLSDLMLSQKIIRLKFLMCSLIVWCASFYCFYSFGYLWRIVSGVAGSLFVIGMSNRFPRHEEQMITKIFNYCGQNSMLIFVLHMPSLLLISKFNEKYNLSASSVGFAINVALGISLPLIIGKMISIDDTIYRYLFGRYPLKTNELKGV